MIRGVNTSMSGVQEERQISIPLVEKINRAFGLVVWYGGMRIAMIVFVWFEGMYLRIVKFEAAGGECVLLDDEGKPLENIDYTGDRDSEDEVEPVDNEIASFLASKPSGVSYGTNSLLEQWRETYRNNNYDYDPYDDNMYEG
ncbi:hypothetical protein Tco_0994560 [Tanacetum coccineum]